MFGFLKRNKKGELTLEEIGKIIIAVVVLAVLVAGVIILLKGGGSDLLNKMRDFLHFGRVR